MIDIASLQRIIWFSKKTSWDGEEKLGNFGLQSKDVTHD